MTDPWSDQLSDYLNGDLPRAQQAGMAAHLETCPTCRQALDELRRVSEWAAAYQASTPPSDPWPVIARRIARHHRVGGKRQVSGGHRALAAAAAIALVAATAIFFMTRQSAPSGIEAGHPGGGAVLPLHPIEQDYAAAIAELQRTFSERRDRLDPETLEIVERSLETIDSAMQEAREALARTPGNTLLQDLLTRSVRQKVGLIRQATALTMTAS
jgi:hypothetical protein